MNLSRHVKMTRVINATAAGTSAINGSVIDMANFDSVMFTVAFGTITSGAVTSIKVQQGAQSDGSDMADLAGTSVTVADTDDNKIFYVDLHRPQERYVRVVVSRATQNAVVDSGTAFQYNAQRKLPVTHDSTTIGTSEHHVSPAEGTA